MSPQNADEVLRVENTASRKSVGVRQALEEDVTQYYSDGCFRYVHSCCDEHRIPYHPLAAGFWRDPSYQELKAEEFYVIFSCVCLEWLCRKTIVPASNMFFFITTRLFLRTDQKSNTRKLKNSLLRFVVSKKKLYGEDYLMQHAFSDRFYRFHQIETSWYNFLLLIRNLH